MGFEVVITSDRTMMSNHHRKEFLGFMATGPAIGLPERLWLWLAAPKPKVDKLGRPVEAPYGLRKIEAKLLELGFNAAIVDPDHIGKHLDSVKVLLVGHHDFFAYGPPSSEWWMLTGKEPVNRVSFRRFMESPAVRKARRKGARIIVGGPAAWQWLWELDAWRRWRVDTVVDGEAERIIGELVEKALDGEPLPDYIYVGPSDTPSVEEIPVIRGASVNGLVEITRGCPRGCRFCSVTLRPLRHIPLNRVRKEIMVNVEAGVRNTLLHSEDVLLYQSEGIKPRPEPIVKLHEMAARLTPGSITWSHVSLASVKYAEEMHGLISRITGEILYDKQEFLGVETGIETGSVRLARAVMPAKAAPYPAEQWPEVVEDAFRIMHENRVVPAATIILGLPGETADDLTATAELIDRLRPYRSLIIPMFFVPMGMLKNRDWFKRHALTPDHVEVALRTLDHSLHWAKDMLNRFYLKEPHLRLVRLGLKLFIGYIKWRMNMLKSEIESFLESGAGRKAGLRMTIQHGVFKGKT